MRAPRPVAATRHLAVVAAMTLALHVISRTTGSGWLVVVVSGLLALLGLSAVLPALSLAGLDVDVRGPTDGTAGRPAGFTVTVGGRARGAKVRLAAPESGWARVDGPGTGPITAVPTRRGVVEHVDVEARSAAPFGLLWWRCRLRVPLARPLEVGPEPLAASSPAAAAAPAGDASDAVTARTGPELVRGLRDYVPGDPRRLVSWVASARHGRLMVKELDDPAVTSRLTIVVDLRGDDAAAEIAASRAAGLALAGLRDGAEVVLATAEPGGPRLGQVASAVEVSRRLARATSLGTPAVPEPGGRIQTVEAGRR